MPFRVLVTFFKESNITDDVGIVPYTSASKSKLHPCDLLFDPANYAVQYLTWGYHTAVYYLLYKFMALSDWPSIINCTA